jgi:uncharacterized protein (TIGR02284 family)
MSAASHDLKHLVAVLRDGEKFYVDAAQKAAQPTHRELFGVMAMAKREIADDLESLLSAPEREDAAEGTWLGQIRACYADARAALAGDKDTVFVGQLEAAEDRVMTAFRETLSTTRARKVRKSLERHYPRAVQAHDRMSVMKHSLSQ